MKINRKKETPLTVTLLLISLFLNIYCCDQLGVWASYCIGNTLVNGKHFVYLVTLHKTEKKNYQKAK